MSVRSVAQGRRSEEWVGFSRLEGTHSLTEACGHSGRGKPALSLLRRVDRGAFLSHNDFFSPEVCVCVCICVCVLAQ